MAWYLRNQEPVDYDGAVAVCGRKADGRFVGPYHYRDADIAERVVRLLVMSGYDVTVDEVPPEGGGWDEEPSAPELLRD